MAKAASLTRFSQGFLGLGLALSFLFLQKLNHQMEYGAWVTFLDFRRLGIFFLILLIFFLLTCRVFKLKPAIALRQISIMAVVVPFFLFLSKLHLSFQANNPFLNSAPYLFYCRFYFYFFSLAAGCLFGRLCLSPGILIGEDGFRDRAGRLFFYLPLLLAVLFYEFSFVLSADYSGTAIFLAGFLASLPVLGKVFARLWQALIKNRAWIAGIVLIFLLAFALRMFWGQRLLALSGENYLRASDDGLTYNSLAITLVENQKITAGNALYWGGIGYWYFLAFIYRFFGTDNFPAVIFIQSLLGALVPVFIFLIAQELFKRRSVALAAACLCALNMNSIFLSAVIGMEALFIPLLFSAFLALALVFTRDRLTSAVYMFVCGLFFGVAFLARQEIVLFPALLFAALSLERGCRKSLRPFLSFTAGMMIFMLAVALYNFLNYRVFTFMTGQAAVTFALPHGSNESVLLDSMGFNPFKSISRSFFVFLHQPGDVSVLFVKSFIKKGMHYLFVPNFGLFDPFYLVNPLAYFSPFPVYVSFFALSFMCVGFWAASKIKAASFLIRLIFIYLFYTFCVYAVIKATNSRHRGVLEPFFLLFTAYGFIQWIGWLKRTKKNNEC